jgi:hypothetical protein
MCNFLLAEERKKQKMFSHTLLGASPMFMIGLCGLGKHILLLLPPLLDVSYNEAVFIHIFSVYFSLLVMGKSGQTSEKSSRAVQRLEPYNKSPGLRSERRASDNASRSKSRSRSRSSGQDREESGDRTQRRERSAPRSRSPEEPPAWATELLTQQRQNAQELKRIKADIAAKSKCGSTVTAATAKLAEPEFRFEGNKTQYRLNKSVVDHPDRAIATDDGDEARNELSEGKKLLTERNKHILLAEKFGWDTVQCYTAEPLASDSEDEKKIRKAVKESKALRNERRVEASRSKAKEQHRAPQKPFQSGGKTPLGNFKAGKFVSNMPRETGITCFRCGRPGHFARDCRSANARYVISSTATNMRNSNQN